MLEQLRGQVERIERERASQVLCDDVAGVAEMFPGRVHVCRGAADLRTAYGAALAAPALPVAGTELSFDDRARELLSAVRDLRGRG